MVRLACANILKLPLQILLKSHPDWEDCPVALVNKDSPYGTILAVNRKAGTAGILPGMRYSAGLSLASDLRAGTVSPWELERWVERLTAALQRFSPAVEARPEEPGIFWLNAEGLIPLYASHHQWVREIKGVLHEHSFHARVAFGFTRFGTYASAKTQPRVFPSRESEAKAALAAPLRILPFPPKTFERLEKLGIKTVGSFLRLSAGGIRKRFGPDAEKLYHFASGELSLPLQPIETAEEIGCTKRLLTAESDYHRLLFHLQAGLESLLARAYQRDQLITKLQLSLILEDAAPRVEKLKPASPSRDLPLLLELISLRLGSEKLAAGVVAFHLSASCVDASCRQLDLFQRRPKRDLDVGARAFARIRAVLGNDSIQIAELESEHLPERSFAWKNAGKPSPAKETAMPGRVIRLVRRMHHRPKLFHGGANVGSDVGSDVKLDVKAHFGSRTVTDGSRLTGPHAISGRWWSDEVDREYYYAETQSGELLWVYYDRLHDQWMINGRVE